MVLFVYDALTEDTDIEVCKDCDTDWCNEHL